MVVFAFKGFYKRQSSNMKCITEIVRRDLTQAARFPLETHNATNTKTHNATCLYTRLLRIFNNNCLTETHSVIDYYTKVSCYAPDLARVAISAKHT